MSCRSAHGFRLGGRGFNYLGQVDGSQKLLGAFRMRGCSSCTASGWLSFYHFRSATSGQLLADMQPVQEGQPPEEDLNPWGHCMVVWGNLLYEHSQFHAAVGKVRAR